jgi:hypothetical protein
MREEGARRSRPGRDESAEYYHGYIARVPDGDVLETLTRQREEFVARLRGIPEELGDRRYAEGKWSVKELIGHLVDTERVFGFRLVAFARGDRSPLPGMEPDDWVEEGGFGARTIADLADEFEALRRANLLLFASLDGEVLLRRGTASGFGFTTRALAWILAGHVMHHEEVLVEHYL